MNSSCSTLTFLLGMLWLGATGANLHAHESWKPYRLPATQRENVFEFKTKPQIQLVKRDDYKITFQTKGYCDVTVSMVDATGYVVRHLGSGVLGANAPEPFQKNTREQEVHWNGKDDLGRYVRDPRGLFVRVALGLKPTFEKRIGGNSPHNLPGLAWGITVAKDGVYVFSIATSSNRIYLRKYDHDGRYLKTLMPPPAGLPKAKLDGLGYVEYEPGKRSVQARRIQATLSNSGNYFVFFSRPPRDCQPAVVGDRVFFCDSGQINDPKPTRLHSIYTDGTQDTLGVAGRPLTWPIGTLAPRLAASPDGRWIYLATGRRDHAAEPLVFRAKTDADGLAKVFVGKVEVRPDGRKRGVPGSDSQSFQMANGIDCDAKGNVYVADRYNNRIQVYAPDASFIKSIEVELPNLVQVHRKTGAIYVLHLGNERGTKYQVGRLTKFESLDNPVEVYRMNDVAGAVFALDSWSEKPRFWVGGSGGERLTSLYRIGFDKGIRVYEEEGKTCRKILDFDEMAKKKDGPRYLRRWKGGSQNGKLYCDAFRNKLYVGGGRGVGPLAFMVDLKTGKCEGYFTPPCAMDDIAFDKRGYMHCHFNPTRYYAGVGRLDPERPATPPFPPRSGPGGHVVSSERPYYIFAESPYNYGVLPRVQARHFEWKGIVPTQGQAGGKSFQDGLGVNMRGDIAVQSNIYYVPKMRDLSRKFAMVGSLARSRAGHYNSEHVQVDAFINSIAEKKRKGIDVYFIKRRPGIPLTGATIWTYDSSGELRAECAATLGDLVNGVQIDEDGFLYTVTARVRVMNAEGQPFLMGRGGIFGDFAEHSSRNPLTGTLMKMRPKDVFIYLNRAPIPLDEPMRRSPDLIAAQFSKAPFSKRNWAWIDGAEWLYAGASPIVFGGCSCSSMRFHTDWFKRTFVSESYRNGIGAVDANGNLILHLGRYGNLDDCNATENPRSLDEKRVTVTHVRFISGTDDRLVYEDYGERIVVLKLGYHAEETVPIQKK